MKKVITACVLAILSLAVFMYWQAEKPKTPTSKTTPRSTAAPTYTLPSAVKTEVGPNSSHLAGNNPLSEFIGLENYDAYIRNVIVKPEPKKVLYAHALATYCLAGTIGRVAHEGNMPPDVQQDSRRIHAYMRIEKLCGQTTNWQELRATLAKLETKDPLMALENKLRKLRSPSKSNPSERQALRETIATLLDESDPVWLSLPERLPIQININLGGPYGVRAAAFQGRWLTDQDEEVVKAAQFLLRCDLGLPCEQNNDVTLLYYCSVLGECFPNREEYVKSKYHAQSADMPSRIAKLRTELLLAIKSGNAEAFIPPPTKQ